MSIVGVSLKSSQELVEYVPIYWSNVNAKPTELPLLDGLTRGFAYGINNLGQIVGYNVDTAYTLPTPIIWTTPDAKPTKLPLLDGLTKGLAFGIAYGINNLGQIVGVCNNAADSLGIPVIWASPNDKPTPLQSFNRTETTIATGINNLGQIVGYSINNEEDNKTSIFWSNSNATPSKLPLSIIKGAEFADLFTKISINDLGQITSYSYDGVEDSIYLPILLPSINARPVNLPLPDGITRSSASLGINNLGQIVGFIVNNNYFLPVIWANANSKPTTLQLLDGYQYGVALGISGPSTSPISNICFPAGTPVQTDQGFIHIDDIDPQIHTINNQTILHITKTTTLDNYLISFEKNSLERNIPCRKTLMTKDHKIMFEGNLVPAYRFLDYSDKVKKVKYSGETLYNVLLAEYGTINVNNLMCETLHPDNIIAKLYMRELKEQPRLICQLNSSLENKDFASYTEVVHRLTHNL
jgi:uncharacterized membrane protein